MNSGARVGTRLRSAVVACAAVGLAGVMSSCVTLEREDVAAPAQGGAVSMRTNTALVVNLPPDPAGGDRWVLRSASPNLALIGGPDFTPAPKPPGLIGVADTTTFRFRALGTGDGALEFAWTAAPGQPPVVPSGSCATTSRSGDRFGCPPTFSARWAWTARVRRATHDGRAGPPPAPLRPRLAPGHQVR